MNSTPSFYHNGFANLFKALEAAAIVQVATMMPEVASNLTSKFEKEEVNMLKDSFAVSVARLMMQNDITCPFHSDAGRG